MTVAQVKAHYEQMDTLLTDNERVSAIPVLVTDDGLAFPVGKNSMIGVGETATLLLRPEHLDIAPETHDGSLGVIAATLEQSVFYGATRKYVCRLANGASITATPSVNGNDTLSEVSSGDRLHLAYRREAPHLIREANDGA